MKMCIKDKKGLRLSRKDKNKPFGPDNFEWVTNIELAQTKYTQ